VRRYGCAGSRPSWLWAWRSWGVSAKPKAAERGPHFFGSIEVLGQLMDGPPAGETPTARLRCTTSTSSDGNILSDCALVAQAPHNEPHLAVNPTNPNNLVADANGYEFYFVGWRAPSTTSGSPSTGGTPGRTCDENQFSVPAVGPGGVLYVAFENTSTAAPDFPAST